jgi:hypothetical protein
MRYTLYEDPITHKFALLRLPTGFLDGDKLPILATDRWFDSREEVVAALPELFDREDPGGGPDDRTRIDDAQSG